MTVRFKSAKSGPDIRHRNEDAVRVVGIFERLKPQLFIEMPTATEMIVFEHVKHDSGGSNLF